ncbi:hypothetical protein K474DRAFT_1608743 [Panus rudis PR-1116 ss-1]|nr:hypothetical protein K474DRAFT_1608743 [Panus rudis PR-1116 ss-1]
MADCNTANGVLDFAAARRTHPGLPPHALIVKKGAVYRLLRNFSQEWGLVKNIHVVVLEMGDHLITVRLVANSLSSRPGVATVPSGSSIDEPEPSTNSEAILIPRIALTHTLHAKYTLIRRQFPLAPAYATTFNSCQGLTLDRVGVDLTRDVFFHGQLYTALSRIRNRNDARIRLRSGETTTTNVTYHDILV